MAAAHACRRRMVLKVFYISGLFGMSEFRFYIKIKRPQKQPSPTMSCSLVSIERELDLAVINAKRNKMMRVVSQKMDSRCSKAHAQRVHMQGDINIDAQQSMQEPKTCSILKCSAKIKNRESTMPKSFETDSKYDDLIRNPAEQQAATFFDELFGEWTQAIKAAMSLDDFKMSKIYNGRNSLNSTPRP
jgi:hypothetical protein